MPELLPGACACNRASAPDANAAVAVNMVIRTRAVLMPSPIRKSVGTRRAIAKKGDAPEQQDAADKKLGSLLHPR